MRALLAPHDKTAIVEFARALRELGFDIVATDGTVRVLRAAGIDASAVADVTGFAEMLDGRVKTLHPAIHAAILARRDNDDHLTQLRDQGFEPIDLVVVSLYPFAATVARGAPDDEVIENIDIGGPTLIRAAAKNADSVTVIVSQRQYGAVLDELRTDGAVAAATRRQLAAEAFAHVAAYDAAVAAWLRDRVPAEAMPAELTTGGAQLHTLRYGENPHQRGALYAVEGPAQGVAHARRLQGSELSFTNWLDVDAARRVVSEFEDPAAAIIKHTNPCGLAVGGSLADAYARAYECDPRSAFGGIVGVNRPLDAVTAEAVAKTFLEAIICPGIAADAAQILARKERLRVLVAGGPSCAWQLDVRSIDGGLLVQTQDRVNAARSSMTVASRRTPTDAEWRDLLIAWRVVRHVKSNAIVVVRDGMAVGVGAGQMSRVEAAELAVQRAGERTSGAVAASDAFFPMPDGLETLAAAGITAVIQPGGSKKDPDVVAAADAHDVAVVHTGERHFRH